MVDVSKPRSPVATRVFFDALRDRATGCRLAILVLAVLSMAAGSATGDVGAGDGEHGFVGAKKCRTCHRKEEIGNQYGVWQKSKHAKAFETLGGEKAAKWAAEKGIDDPQTNEKCVKCHVTAYGVSEERLSKQFQRNAGVQCESCHGAGNDYRKKKIMMDRELAESKGLVPRSQLEKRCVGCHNDESPAWKPDRYTRPDGTKVGFDYEQALEAIAHPVPEGYDPMAGGEAD